MEPINYDLTSGTLNQVFNKIKNCRVVKPPYDDWYYTNNFFLDKRLWLEQFLLSTWKKILDIATIKGIEYILYQEWWKSYIWALNGTSIVNVTPSWFNINSDTPIKLVFWKWLYWVKESTRTVWSPTVWTWEEAWPLIPWYAQWYVKFTYSWTKNLAVWDFIVFKNWALAWWVNRIEYINNNNIYIIWTNARGTLPKAWDEVDIYKAWTTEYGTTIVMPHTAWLDLVILNWLNTANSFRVLTTSSEPIIDCVNFDWNIFALTKTHMYFSRSTFDDNTQFYPLDYYFIDGWYKLFSMWKVLLCFGRQNKLFASANSTTTTVWYVWYDVNYNWDLFSKYSCIFTDQTIYVLQKDKQLKQIDIVQNNATTFDLKLTDVIPQTKWLFNWLEWWDVFINSDSRMINFLHIKDWKTTNYQYDKMYQHFIEQEYNEVIYYFWEKILSKDKIYIENNYLDDWEEYSQEVNFMLDTWMLMYKPYILRTIFWLVPNEFNVNLDVKLELWWKIFNINKNLFWFKFDWRLSTSLTADELIWFDTLPSESTEYNWTIVSIQTPIAMVWRFIRFKYNSQHRFMMWNSYIISDKQKPYINEIY